MRILFLGQNPSLRAWEAGHREAFIGSASGKRLLQWIDEAGIPREICEFANVLPILTPEKPSLTQVSTAALEQQLGAHRAIVVCGAFARGAVSRVRLYSKPDVAYIQHPSGLNRNLNNKAKIREQVQAIRTLYEVSRARQG